MPRALFGMLLAFILVVIGIPACRVTDVPLWLPPGPPAEELAVEQIRNVAYYEGPDADSVRHRLDLFLPHGVKDYPVVVFVHGGSWIGGDNRCCGLYSSVGEFLASQGIGAVLPNYRLSPGIKHPEHVRDVARAVAWTRAHIAEHGGRADQLFLVGHSAGGHLVSLLATDEKYLKAEGLEPSAVKGVIAVSGVYNIPPGSLHLTLGGSSPRALRMDQVYPLRGLSGRMWARLAGIPDLPIRLNVFAPAFGDDPQTRADASPLNHVRPGLPPFLLCYGSDDLPTLSGMAREFHHALREQGCDAELLRVKERNHHSIIFRAIQADDPVAGAMLDFVREHTAAVSPPR